MMDEKVISEITREVLARLNSADAPQPATGNVRETGAGTLPIGISARHLHISEEDLQVLYGPGAELHAFKPLLQKGEFAAEETVTLVGPRMRCLGPVRIRRELSDRGIDSALADAALAACEEDWSMQAETVRRKRFGVALPVNAREHGRQARFLAYRGFSREQIGRVLRGLHH